MAITYTQKSQYPVYENIDIDLLHRKLEAAKLDQDLARARQRRSRQYHGIARVDSLSPPTGLRRAVTAPAPAPVLLRANGPKPQETDVPKLRHRRSLHPKQLLSTLSLRTVTESTKRDLAALPPLPSLHPPQLPAQVNRGGCDARRSSHIEPIRPRTKDAVQKQSSVAGFNSALPTETSAQFASHSRLLSPESVTEDAARRGSTLLAPYEPVALSPTRPRSTYQNFSRPRSAIATPPQGLAQHAFAPEPVSLAELRNEQTMKASATSVTAERQHEPQPSHPSPHLRSPAQPPQKPSAERPAADRGDKVRRRSFLAITSSSRREEKDRMRVYTAEVREPSDTESRFLNRGRESRILDVAGEDWQHFMPGDAKDEYGHNDEEMQEGEQKRDKMRKRRSIIGWFKHA